ncbi:MAG: helix-turn-helix domain-containing protein, partial [Candidatus Thermoplasmatota archaeon]|nr:helix-turn-helix domain-containing protein [Candidatus Thermoplasmatota archaeon]
PTEGNYITHISNSNNIKGSYFVENNIILNFFNTSDFNSRVVSFRNYTISLSSVNSNTTISYIIDVSTINYTINWNGNMITVIEQPSNAIVVRLPNNRFGIKYMDKEPVTLPINSSLLDKNEVNTTSSIIILVPEWNSLIGLNAIENFSIDELTSISYSQKVNALNSYKLATDLIGLRNYSDYIHSYWIDWGDGHNESVTIPFLRYITMTNKTVFYKPTNTVIGTWSSNNFNLLNDKYNFLPIHKYSKSGDYKISIGTEDIFGNNYILSRNTTILYEGGLKHTYFIVVEHKETVTAGAGGIGLLSLLIIFTESGKYKFLSFLLFIPLYTRFNKEDILDNFVRGQIYGFIKTQPGVHYNNIMRELDLKNGTLSYHLQMLEKTGLVKSRMEGLQYRAFYPTGMKFPEKERYRLSDLQIEILKIIKEKDGIIQNEIRDKLGEKRQIINYNVKVLHQAGLIKAIRKGRETHCYLTDEGRGITEFADESANENTISANESP